MDFKPFIKRSLLATVGYFLSPFSWWNDLYVNFPIAYGAAWLVSLVDKRLFAVTLVVSYWVTNIAGLIMLHKGLAPAISTNTHEARWYRKKIVTDLAISLAYTGVIILLLYSGLIKLPQEYFINPTR